MFTARPGHVLVVGDLDRIEVCILAFYLEVMFGDTTYSDAVRAGLDVHQLNADNWGIERPPAKNGLFSWIYGAQVEKFAQTTGLSIAQAKRVFIRMEESNPALFMYREACERQALENNGKLYNFMGGMHYIPDILSQERWIQAAGKRKASNYIIQGTAASLFKYLQVQKQVRDLCREVNARIVLAVHDEALYEVPIAYGQYFAEQMTSHYTTIDLLREGDIYVPVSAEFHVGKNWLEAKNV
jgi:DNA polymerase-1